MPLSDWYKPASKFNEYDCSNEIDARSNSLNDNYGVYSSYHKGFIYVSGHTHRNYYYDDGEIRIYADNQIGYSNNLPHLKWFETDNTYDYFSDYPDGIHEISADDYIQFYRGKNIRITFTRSVNTLYMLKKNGLNLTIVIIIALDL